MEYVINMPYAPRWINSYVFNHLCNYSDTGVSESQSVVPIFAVSPTNIEDLYKKLTELTGISEPLLIQYDRLVRFRPNSFYPHKKEQVLYYFYSTNISYLNNAMIVISQILDREDASAEDINAWCSANPLYNNGDLIPYNVFFHNVKVFQTEEARDIYDPASNKTIFASKMIIEYDYHAKNDSTFK